MTSLYKSTYTEYLLKAKELFPYQNWNDNQLKIIQGIVSLEENGCLFLESPTGSGKTIASLTSLLARLDENQKIIIFTRTVSQMEPILREWGRIYSFESIQGGDAPLIVPLLGKSRMCKQYKVISNSQLGYKDIKPNAVQMLCKGLPCKLHPSNDTKGLYKGTKYKLLRLNQKIHGLAKNSSPRVEELINFLNANPPCGYYLIKQMVRYATIVVASFPFMKDPLFSNLLKSLNSSIEDVMILVDEAHNLIQSNLIEISKDDILVTKDILGNFPIFDKMLNAMKSSKKIEPEQLARSSEYENLIQILSSANPSVRKQLGVDYRMLVQPEVTRFLQFLRSRYNGRIQSTRSSLKILEISPSHYLSHFKDAALQIYQSGTFQPIDVYKKMYGKKSATSLIIARLRPEQEFRAFTGYRGVTSKMSARGSKMYQKMSEIILLLARISPRHQLVIVPSYDFMEGLTKHLNKMNQKKSEFQYDIIEEKKDLNIKRLGFRIKNSLETKILVGVSGGKMTEGIEFVVSGNSLLSTVVFCGLPYKPVTEENQIIMNQIASIASDFRVAKQLQQTIPISMAVRQAFGRTIRSDIDRGALIILDYRAEKLLKRSLGLKHIQQLKTLLTEIKSFFRGYASLDELQKNR